MRGSSEQEAANPHKPFHCTAHDLPLIMLESPKHCAAHDLPLIMLESPKGSARRKNADDVQIKKHKNFK